MAIILNSTLTDQYANSYVDQPFADDYWSAHYDQTKAGQWSALEDGQKTRLLIEACRVIETARFTIPTNPLNNHELYYDRRTHMVLNLNRQMLPLKVYYFQSLQFPRTIDRDTSSGALFVPEPIKNAQCEQALYILNFDESTLSSRIQGVTEESVSVGAIRTRQSIEGTGSKWSPTAFEYAKPFMLKRSATIRRA